MVAVGFPVTEIVALNIAFCTSMGVPFVPYPIFHSSTLVL